MRAPAAGFVFVVDAKTASAQAVSDEPTASSPSASSTPRWTFMLCTAAPLAPLPRLSSRAISSAWLVAAEHEDVHAVGVVAALYVEAAGGDGLRDR